MTIIIPTGRARGDVVLRDMGTLSSEERREKKWEDVWCDMKKSVWHGNRRDETEGAEPGADGRVSHAARDLEWSIQHTAAA
jgi:hypothetical protein